MVDAPVIVGVGNGLTVIVKVIGVPEQVNPAFVKAGVTMMVATTGIVEVLATEKEEILPVPAAARPMEVFELIQLYKVPGTFPEITTDDVEA